MMTSTAIDLRRMAQAGLFGAILFGVSANLALGVMTHQYTFNDGTARDSVAFVPGNGLTTFDIGGADGVIVDNTNIRTFTGGALDITANNNANSAQDFTNPATVGAFVNLPNGIFTNAVKGGTFGAVTVEAWMTVQENRDWARLWDFGASGPGEDLSGGSGSAQYVFVAPRIGGNGSGHQFVAAGSTHNAGDIFAASPAELTVNVQHHVTFTLDQNDLTGGPDGTSKFYVDNQPVVVSGIAPGLFLDSIPDFNNFIGRAQWGDPLFDGLINELRIYDTALDAATIASNTLVQVPLPVLRVNRSTGEITVANPAGTQFNLKSYSISSANGGLNPTGWTSIDTGNAFDTDGTWTSSSTTVSSIAEGVTGGVLDGGPIAAGASKTIGTAWAKTPLSSDLQFSFVLNGGTSGAGIVEYTGTAPLRSDLNGDGLLTPADWTTFVTNHGTSLAGNLPAVAYAKGDLDGNLTNDYADYVLFKGDYIAANGGAAFAALGALPEPASVALAAVAFAGIAVRTRRQGRQR